MVEGLFRFWVRSWSTSLIAAERTISLLQPDGAVALAASTSLEREGGFPGGKERYTCPGEERAPFRSR